MSAPRLFSHSRSTRALAGTRAILPGLGLCVAVTAAAIGFEAVETHLFGRAWLEALVLAILLGSAIRTAWT
ncbi:MAG: putative sulfate exporter family transporter, partial [Oxalobacteraceae bacterium]